MAGVDTLLVRDLFAFFGRHPFNRYTLLHSRITEGVRHEQSKVSGESSKATRVDQEGHVQSSRWSDRCDHKVACSQ